MASRIVARSVASRLAKSPSAVQRFPSARAFGSAVQVEDDSSVHVNRGTDGQKSQEQSVSKQGGGQNQSSLNRGWPGSFFGGGPFSPLFPSLMRPTSLMQMMDTVDRIFSSFDSPASTGLKSRIPWDVIEDEKSFKMRMDMPGLSKQEVKLTVEDGDLVVKAEHSAEEADDDWSARSYGSHYSRIKLPENVDLTGIKAEMKDGVLKVMAPKAEAAKQKHEVQVE